MNNFAEYKFRKLTCSEKAITIACTLFSSLACQCCVVYNSLLEKFLSKRILTTYPTRATIEVSQARRGDVQSTVSGDVP